MANRFELSDFVYAHRGLWTEGGLTENSLEACLAAAEAGLGIEFDVRPSADGVPIVFHDSVLGRMTDREGIVEQLHSTELLGLPLRGGGTIVSLSELLTRWPGRTPLLCELKIDGNTGPVAFAGAVSTLLMEYRGPVAAMSFSPQAVAALPKQMMRGQLIIQSDMTGHTDLPAIAQTEVDYFACHTSDAGHASLQTVRAKTPLVTWTVTDPETCNALAPLTDSQIFEGFDPELAKRHILNT